MVSEGRAGGARRRWLAVGGVALVLLALVAIIVLRRPASTPAHLLPAPVLADAWTQPWSARPAGDRPIELHAAPAGSGTACRADQPCSLVAARDRVRQLAPTATQDLVVRLADGTYRLTEPLALDLRDAAPPGRRVTWEAEPGARPVLSGGTEIEGWRVEADGTWVADVDPGLATRQLLVDGRRATRARSDEHPAGWERTAEGFRAPNPAAAAWADPSAVEIVSRREWKSVRCPVAAVAGVDVVMAQPCWRNANAKDPQSVREVTFVENARELLDAPGEWHLDRQAHQLRYRPRPGEEPTRARVVAPRLETILSITGTREQPVHGLAWRGITFADSTWLAPSAPTGYAVLQAGWHVVGDEVPPVEALLDRTPGAVSLSYAQDLRFERDTFTRLGAAGLDLRVGSQAIGVVGNRFEDVASHGIQVGETGPGSARPDERNDWLDRLDLRSNVIEHVGAEYEDAVGIFVSYASNVSIVHNDVQHLPYSGISIGWGWGTDSYAERNVIQANHVGDVMRVLNDGGGIYTLSRQASSSITANWVHDVVHDNGALYLDEGSREWTLNGNVVARAPRWLHIWTSTIRDNRVVGNWADTDESMDEGTDNEIRDNALGLGEWPPEAQAVVDAAGVEPAYRDAPAAG